MVLDEQTQATVSVELSLWSSDIGFQSLEYVGLLAPDCGWLERYYGGMEENNMSVHEVFQSLLNLIPPL